MAAVDDHDALLDQLQSQVNLVLEQTGRIFAAIATNPRDRPNAQITKLKTSMPVATNHFHNALDQLESQLQLATLVMRRDLAVSRERAGLKPQPSTVQAPAPAASQPTATSEATQEDEKEVAASNQDVKAIDAAGHEVNASAPQPTNGDNENDISMEDWLDTAGDEKATPKPDVTGPTTAETTANPTPPPLEDMKPSIAAHTLPTTTSIDTNAATSTTQLQLDTKEIPTTTSNDDEKAPDTANNDLDSLFNDPDPQSAPAEAEDDFTFDHSGTTDMMDFTNFDANADNDNISSLLPGLEDYANTQPNSTGGGDMDFDSLFTVPANNDAMNAQGAGEQRDTTFDDLMDLSGFDGLDGGGDAAAGGDGNNTADAFDFDSLFN